MSRFPRGFNAWVVATVGADLGSGVLAFALTWVASGYSANAAAMVLTLSVAPSVLFGLLGGAVADRFGARRVMIACTVMFMLVSATLAVVVFDRTAMPLTLGIAAVCIGTISAFHRPAVGVFPRLFVTGDALGTAMSRVGVASQVAAAAAPAVGGVLIAMVALSGVAWVDVAGCVGMLAVLLMIHPPLSAGEAREAMSLRGIVSGITSARRTAGVPPLLLCVGLLAGAVLPAVILGIPLAARERGWSAADAGAVEACWIIGGIAAGAWFSWRGTVRTVWLPMAIGVFLVAVGLCVLAVAPLWPLAAGGTLVVGVGVVIFTAHVFPTYVLLAPPNMLSRFQSLLIIVQRAPQLVIAPVIGAVVALTETGPMLLGAAGLAVAAAVVVARNGKLRGFTTA